MFKLFLALALFVVLTHQEVYILDDSNYTTFIQQNRYVFVKFYAPWCGHCQQMVPVMQELGNLAAGKKYKIAKLDATAATNAAQSVGIAGFPTLKLFVDGYGVPFEGGRTAQAIQEWIEHFLNSELKSLTEAELKQKLGTEDILLLQGLSERELETLKVSCAVLSSDLSCYVLTGAGSTRKIGLHLENSKSFEYSEQVDGQKITKWVITSSTTALVALKTRNLVGDVYQNPEKLPALLLLRYSDFGDDLLESLTQICQQNQKQFKCGVTQQPYLTFKPIQTFLKNEAQRTIIALIPPGFKFTYKLSNPLQFTSESIKQFVEDCLAGKIAPYIDSQKQKTSKQVHYNHVLELNSETYNSTISNSPYVFVQYYSPTCTHCVQFASKYDSLASKAREENLGFEVASVNMQEQSEISNWVSIQGYPTFKLFAHGTEIEYNGPRDIQEIITFVQKARDSRLLKPTQQISKLERPFVAVYGAKQDDLTRYLPLIGVAAPVYLASTEGDLRIQYHSKSVLTYSGQLSLVKISQWLGVVGSPTLVNIVSSQNSKQLQNAMKNKYPLLVFNKREEGGDHVLKVLQQYCQGKTAILCGHALPAAEEYIQFDNWLNDSVPDKNRLVYISTENFNKYLYEGNLNQLSVQDIQSFLQGIKDGTIPQQAAKAKEDQGSAQEGEQEQNQNQEL